MKAHIISIGASTAAAISKDDIIFIISIIIVVLQLISGYLERKKEKEKDE